jgi:hypothetical protein
MRLRKLFLDSNLADEIASNKSVINLSALYRYLEYGFKEFERCLYEQDFDKQSGIANMVHIPNTDWHRDVVSTTLFFLQISSIVFSADFPVHLPSCLHMVHT